MTTTPPAVLEVPERRSLRTHRWLRFAVRRAGRLLVSLWALVTLAFGMIHLIPGDPVRAALGITATPALVEQTRENLGLNEPLWVQYGHFWQGLFTGDLGTSIFTRLPITDVITARLGATAALALSAFLVAVLIAIPLGTAIAVRTRRGRGRKLELGFATTSVVLGTIPDFLIGVALVWIFAVTLKWFPVGGRTDLSSYILPVLALSIGPAAILARIVRVEVLAVLETDYVRTARAKRLSAVRINLGHALPNAITASLTLGGLLLSSMVAGTVLVENVFAWPGLSSTIVDAIQAKDYPVVQAVVLIYGIGVLGINTLVDVVLALLDPRTMTAEP